MDSDKDIFGVVEKIRAEKQFTEKVPENYEVKLL